MKWIVKLFVNALAVILTAYLLPGVSVENFLTALLVAVVLALLNSFLKPILIILTIPVTIITFGLFLLVINAVIILLADDLIDAFHVNSFWWALLFSLVMSFFTSLFNRLDKDSRPTNNNINEK